MTGALPAAAAEQAPVDIEFIEFLGTFTTEDGEFVDPTGWIAEDAQVAAMQLPDPAQEDDDDDPVE